MLNYLTPADVTAYHTDPAAPRSGQTVTGYGPKIPTRFRLTLTDGRTRRVYVAQYGNSGSAYVIRNGQDHYLTPDVEHVLEGSGPVVVELEAAALAVVPDGSLVVCDNTAPTDFPSWSLESIGDGPSGYVGYAGPGRWEAETYEAGAAPAPFPDAVSAVRWVVENGDVVDDDEADDAQIDGALVTDEDIVEAVAMADFDGLSSVEREDRTATGEVVQRAALVTIPAVTVFYVLTSNAYGQRLVYAFHTAERAASYLDAVSADFTA